MELKDLQSERLGKILHDIRFPLQFIHEVDAVAKRFGLTRPQVIRFAALAGLREIAQGKLLPIEGGFGNGNGNGGGEKKV